MKEWQKIGSACFAGGFICALVALSVMPQLWWLGLIAGFCGGYLAYEFKGVLHNALIAFKMAVEGLKSFFQGSWYFLVDLWEISRDFRDWLFKKAAPVFSASLIVSIPVWFFGVMMESFEQLKTYTDTDLIIYPSFFYLVVLALSASVLRLVVKLGAYGDYLKENELPERYLNIGMWVFGGTYTNKLPLNYPNFLRWLFMGILIMLWKPTKWAIKWTILLVFNIVKFLFLFVWYLFKLIHSSKRLLCGIDGAVGGAIAFWYFQSLTLPVEGKIMTAVLGGLIGAVIGILNWQIISVRLFKFHLAKSG